MRSIFAGTGVAIVTPFRKDGSIDFSSLEKLVEHQVSNGINYIVVLGTTGESTTIGKDEKAALISFIKEQVNKRVGIVVGCGGNNTTEILNSIRGIDFDGIDGLLSVSPYYNKPSQEGIFQHYKMIAEQSPVPVIIYNVPGRTGSNISPETTLRLAEVNNIVATKEACGNLTQIMQIIKNKPKDFMVISGDDALSIPIIAMGGCGVISVIANAYPAEMSNLTNFALQGKLKEANELHYKLFDLINAIFEDGSPGGIKEILKIKKLADNNLRLPLVPVNSKTAEKIQLLVKSFK